MYLGTLYVSHPVLNGIASVASSVVPAAVPDVGADRGV